MSTEASRPSVATPAASSAPPSGAGTSRRPEAVKPPARYVWLHQCLLADIVSGKYPVGGLLPTEEEIGRVYGVSRHTVREATRKLVDAGLISRQPSVGTVVKANRPAAPYVAALGSLKELMAYTDSTRLELLSYASVQADALLAERLDCSEGEQWLKLCARRHLADQDASISFTHVYLRPEFEGICAQLRGNHPSVYSMLQDLYGQPVHSVKQDIEATLMPPDIAQLIGVAPGSPALGMLRRYYDPDGRLLTASDNLYIAERFRLSSSWSKDGAARFF